MRTRSAAFLMLFFVGQTLLATTEMPLRLDQVRDRSASVLIGTIASVRTGTSLSGAVKVDEYRVNVSETIRGGRLKTVVVRVPRLDGAPHLQKGSQYVFFLGAAPGRALVSLQQGVYRVENASLLVSGANEPLVMGSDGVLRLGAPVTIEHGQVKAMQSAPSVDIGAPEVPSSAEHVSPMSAPSAAVVSKPVAQRYATLDDLRRFVQSDVARRTR